jgi:hypothetical protein
MISQPRWTEDDFAGTGPSSETMDDNRHPVDDLVKHLAELRDYAAYYLETRKDQLRISLTQLLIYAALGALALAIGVCAVGMATALVLLGVSGGLGELLGGRVWAGALVTGLVALGGLAAVVYFGLRRMTHTSQQRLADKYERRREDFRSRYGREVGAGHDR